ncbi:MAG: erythromycin esterase [Acidobacteria bacterium]|nr:MAG: erythromycin esterase [Acidobacteriota bacterium]
MSSIRDSALSNSDVDVVRKATLPLGSREDFDPLLSAIGETGLVLIGEASHGTHEFYRVRAEITKRLLAEKGFGAVAIEGDWPDAWRVNRYVRGRSEDRDASEALAGFRRFPTWMWRNTDVLDFVGWLRAYNEGKGERAAGFYGLDLYSLHASMEAVLGYLDTVDAAAARRARERYACFDHFGEDVQAYGYAAGFGLSETCEKEVVAQLVELRRRAADYAARDGRVAEDDYFQAEQNARLVLDAEQYYRSMFQGRVSSWNLRDTHMADTLDALVAHHARQGRSAKVVVWAHNSHLGDARATQMGREGELNLGQLARERHPGDAFLAGFSTHTGTVTAATDWGAPAERKRVRPSLPGSYERLFHETAQERFLLLAPGKTPALNPPRLQRAIGVIYRPDTERASHYFEARLGAQFDAVLHYDVTRAVEPLERGSLWDDREPPETYPTGI